MFSGFFGTEQRLNLDDLADVLFVVVQLGLESPSLHHSSQEGLQEGCDVVAAVEVIPPRPVFLSQKVSTAGRLYTDHIRRNEIQLFAHLFVLLPHQARSCQGLKDLDRL